MITYSASLLFRRNAASPDNEGLWEERIILICAEGDEEALKKAELIGKEEEHSYKTTSNTAEWVFESVERLYSIDSELKNGTEVFSRFLRESEARSLLTPFDD